MSRSLFRFAFASSCTDFWGGSEELWAGAAHIFAGAGHRVRAFKTNVDRREKQIIKLEAANCPVKDLQGLPPKPLRLLNRFLPHDRQPLHKNYAQKSLDKALRSFQPHLTVVSQGINFDGVYLAEVCRRQKLPYVVVAQKAVDFLFPADEERAAVRAVYESAVKCFFVSRHNLNLTEEQIGAVLPNAEIVFNPFAVPFENSLSWNEEDGNVRLACVARLFIIDKGQDILLRVLAMEKWKKRNVEVVFFGEGVNKQALVEMARLLEVRNVKFAGYVGDVEHIWKESHALVLPSRSEGLPLALVEAMLYGRPSIVTDVGGMAEIIDDNVTGFVAAAPTAQAFDEALERAWMQRRNWRQIGIRAADSIKKIVPREPCRQFADRLLELTKE
ncbi:MAG TPA: glycosyltransferase family 4 protein [Pyrinomonadaceae bacterium]